MSTNEPQIYTVKVYANGSKHWYQNGKRHRVDGPVIETTNGTKFWYQNGERHRTDGPAIDRADGTKEWWIDGNQFTEQEFNKKMNSCDGKIVEIDGKKYTLNLVK